MNVQSPFPVVPVVLSGGAGTRLWPLARESLPKPFMPLPDGGTLLMANTKHYTEAEAETGVPGLSKIPFLKRLFDNRGTVRHNDNTLILVRPKIIIQAEEEHLLGYDSF